MAADQVVPSTGLLRTSFESRPMRTRAGIIIAGPAVQVIQRGVNRAACFFLRRGSPKRSGCTGSQGASADLAQGACRGDMPALVSNEVHRLARSATADRISPLMKAHGQRNPQSANRAYRPRGPLWERRCRSCPVETDCYRLACRYYTDRPRFVRRCCPNRPTLPGWSAAANSGLDAGPGNHIPYACLGPGSTLGRGDKRMSASVHTQWTSGASMRSARRPREGRRSAMSGSGHWWRSSRGARASSPLPMRKGNCCSDGETNVVCGVFTM